ncbi:hypothetical protein GF336_05320 [Candidatus Woesearchaeota archaeon]|nr:hypothetical protein [Candidatus Woesearchaeota archaeon]
MNKIQHIYYILHKTYGSQGWWPTTLEDNLHPTYHGKKHSEKQKFEIIVGAVLTQNTSWKNAEKAIFNLNKDKSLSIEKLRPIRKDKLASLIRPSGYFNQKAERLKIISDFFSKNPLSDFKKLSTEKARDILLSIKGIGPETADSILLYAFSKPIFVIDAYTKRIFSRIGLCNRRCDYSELQDVFHKSLPKRHKIFNEYHALIVELAKRHCTKKPSCRSCPINRICKNREA